MEVGPLQHDRLDGSAYVIGSFSQNRYKINVEIFHSSSDPCITARVAQEYHIARKQ